MLHADDVLRRAAAASDAQLRLARSMNAEEADDLWRQHWRSRLHDFSEQIRAAVAPIRAETGRYSPDSLSSVRRQLRDYYDEALLTPLSRDLAQLLAKLDDLEEPMPLRRLA